MQALAPEDYTYQEIIHIRFSYSQCVVLDIPLHSRNARMKTVSCANILQLHARLQGRFQEIVSLKVSAQLSARTFGVE